MRFKATRGSLKVSMLILWLPRESPLESGDKVEPRRWIAVDLLIMPVERIAQIPVDGHAAPQVVIHVHAEVGKTGVAKETRRGAEVWLDVERFATREGGQI